MSYWPQGGSAVYVVLLSLTAVVWLVHMVMRHPPACPELWRSLSVLLSRWGKPGRQTRFVSRRMVLADIACVCLCVCVCYDVSSRGHGVAACFINLPPPWGPIWAVNEGQREQAAHRGSHTVQGVRCWSLLQSPFAFTGQCHAMRVHCGTDHNRMYMMMQPFCPVSSCLTWIQLIRRPDYLAKVIHLWPNG